jgi:hypothetical protein
MRDIALAAEAAQASNKSPQSAVCKVLLISCSPKRGRWLYCQKRASFDRD